MSDKTIKSKIVSIFRKISPLATDPKDSPTVNTEKEHMVGLVLLRKGEVVISTELFSADKPEEVELAHSVYSSYKKVLSSFNTEISRFIKE